MILWAKEKKIWGQKPMKPKDLKKKKTISHGRALIQISIFWLFNNVHIVCVCVCVCMWARARMRACALVLVELRS